MGFTPDGGNVSGFVPDGGKLANTFEPDGGKVKVADIAKYDSATDPFGVKHQLDFELQTLSDAGEKYITKPMKEFAQKITDKFGTAAPQSLPDGALAQAGVEHQGNILGENIDRSITELKSVFQNDDEARKYYEAHTGRKYYTDAELSELDSGLRREIEHRQRDTLTGFGEGLVEMAKGIPRVAVTAAKGLSNAYDKGGMAEAGRATGRALSDLTAATIAGFGDTLGHPNDKLTNDPVGALTDALTITGAGAAAKAGLGATEAAVRASLLGAGADAVDLAKTAGALANRAAPVSEIASHLGAAAQAGAKAIGGPLAAAGKGVLDVAKELSPVPLAPLSLASKGIRAAARPSETAAKAVDLGLGVADYVANKFNKPGIATGAKAAAQVLLDARAGVDRNILQKIEDIKLEGSIRKKLTGTEIADALQGVAPDEVPVLRDILAGERTRDVAPRWLHDLPNLRRQIDNAVRNGVPKADLLAALNQGDVSNLINTPKFVGKGKNVTSLSDFAKAMQQRDLIISAEVGGKTVDIGSPSALLFGKEFDPKTVTMAINPNAPAHIQEIAARNMDALERLRQVTVKLGEDSTKIRVGKTAKESLLPADLYRTRTAYYTPDVYVGANADGLRNAMRPIVTDTVGSTNTMSKIKNLLGFEARAKYGATEDLLTAYQVASKGAIDDIQRYKLLEAIDDAGLAKSTAAPGMVRVPDGMVKGNTKLPIFGAIAGKYVDRNLLNYLTQVDSNLLKPRDYQRIAMKMRAAFGGAKVAMNILSHVNNFAGNMTHHIVDAGLAGTASYAASAAKELASGLRLLKDDKFRAAADAAGVIKDSVDMPAHELAKLESMVSKQGIANGMADAVIDQVKHYGEKLTDAAVAVYANKDKNAAWYGKPSYAAGKVLEAGDNASRMAFFSRFMKREAAAAGMKLDDALKNPQMLMAARRHVEQFHIPYDNVPLGISAMDKYGLVPFSRYGWTAIKMLVNAPANNPQVYRTAVNADRQIYDRLSGDDKLRQDIAPSYRQGRTMPLTPPGPNGQPGKDLNYSGFVPYTTSPANVFGVADRGGYGEQQYAPITATNLAPGGLPGSLAMIAMGKNPQTGGDFKPDLEWLDQGTRSRALLDLFGPGVAYSAGKVKSAIAHKPDARGRVMTTEDAVLHALGVKLEASNPTTVINNVDNGMLDRTKQLDKQQSMETQAIQNLSGKEFEDALGSIVRKYNALRHQVGDSRGTLLKRRQ